MPDVAVRIGGTGSALGQWARHLPGGVLEDILPHPLSIVLALLGREARLTHRPCFCTSDAADAGNDELRLALESPQCTANLALSLSAQPDDFAITLYGTTGTLRVDLQDMLLHQLRLRPGPKAVARGLKVLDANTRALAQLLANFMRIAARRGSPPADVQPMLQRFYASLLEGSPMPASAEDGLRVVQMLRSIWPAPHPT